MTKDWTNKVDTALTTSLSAQVRQKKKINNHFIYLKICEKHHYKNTNIKKFKKIKTTEMLFRPP